MAVPNIARVLSPEEPPVEIGPGEARFLELLASYNQLLSGRRFPVDERFVRASRAYVLAAVLSVAIWLAIAGVAVELILR